jgi:uncharacterized caspase-like protein
MIIYLASSETKPDIHMLRSFSLDALTDLMNQSISKRIVAILDCCHSGAAKLDRVRVNEEDTVSVAENAIDNKSKALRQGEEGRCILVASLGPQKGYDLKEKGHGIFTYYYLEGLNGNEDSVDKYRNVTVSSLGNFVYDVIVNLSEEKGQNKNH